MMQRRGVIRIFAAAATGLWANQHLLANPFLQASSNGSGNGNRKVKLPFEPASQDSSSEPLLPLFPLPVVLTPRRNLPLHIYEERYKEMIQDCLQNRWEFGMLLLQDGALKNIGCTASITEVVNRYPDGRMDIIVQGQRRFETLSLNQEKSYLRGRPQFFEDDETALPPEALRRQALQLYDRVMELLKQKGALQESSSLSVSDPSLSFAILSDIPASLSLRQSLLELKSENERLMRVAGFMQQLIELLESSPDQKPPEGTA
ncbi:MAG: hypothetical protein A3F68_10950 [Acidobacteria bacterium RIFCSPLOWO2_12_FULL_54_10]|nr:MAG: hypothetical protein A3F68_10950 [Acidobacteria bacterium RIFCSPLOWO2_12_FULL_54_10]